jgi:hypothetical protein
MVLAQFNPYEMVPLLRDHFIGQAGQAENAESENLLWFKTNRICSLLSPCTLRLQRAQRAGVRLGLGFTAAEA